MLSDDRTQLLVGSFAIALLAIALVTIQYF